MNKRIIEIVGAAGCGKSFIAQKLSEHLKSKAIVNTDIKLSPIKAVGITLINMHKVLLLFYMIGISNQSTLKIYWRLFIKQYLYLIKKEYIKRYNNDITYVIIDEGFLHRIRRIRRYSKINDWGFKSIPNIVKTNVINDIDVVIYVKCDSCISNKRKLNRGRGLEVDKSRYEMAMVKYRSDIIEAKESIGFYLIEVDNTGNNIDEKIYNILNEIEDNIYNN